MKRFKTMLSVTFVLVVALVSAFPSHALAATNRIQAGNRVYFYNMSGNGAASSDFIIVESMGHWGLIDSGHRFKNTITDADGKTYPVCQGSGLSSQVKDKYGLAAAQYMVDTLGVEHLDFIVGTHAHSDHLGGVPEIAEYSYKNDAGKKRHLVDDNTVYFYKEYQHINNEQDDIMMPSTGSWHNQAFAFQAKAAMKKQGCVLVDVSNGMYVEKATQKQNDFSAAVNAVNSINGMRNARYDEGNLNDYYDDNITFSFGEVTISLYNLFMHKTSIDENVNSIVAVICYNGHTLASLADINVENCAEQKVAKAVYSRFGRVDVMKAAHHGVTRGSNSKETIDLLQPKAIVATRGISDVYAIQVAGAYANTLYYAKPKYGTVFYEVGASDRALVVDLADIAVYSLNGQGNNAMLQSASSCINRMSFANGWSNWDNQWGDVTIRDIFYFQNGSYKTGWIKWNNKWFYMSATGKMQTGWGKVAGKWYFFNTSQAVAADYGAAVSGWLKISGKWYHFDSANTMETGWKHIGSKWYLFSYSDGKMLTGWAKSNGRWYYLNASGAMQTGWLWLGGKWYYLDNSGKMLTGRQRISGITYYFDANGVLV